MSKAEKRIRNKILFTILVLGGIAVALSLLFIRPEDMAAADLFDLFSLLFRSVVGILALIVVVFVALFLWHRAREIKKVIEK